MTPPTHLSSRVLGYSAVGVPESRVRRFFRRDLPLTIIVVLLTAIATFVAIVPRID